MELSEDIKKQLKDRLAELPRPLQEAVTSDAVIQNVRAITEKHALNLWQGQLLENEVLITLLGLEPRKGFARSVRAQLEVDEATAAKITQDVNEKIFKSIREMVQESNIQPAKEEDPVEAEFARPTPAHNNVEEERGLTQLDAEDPLSQSTRENSNNITLPKESGERVPPEKTRPYSTDPYREPVE